MGNYSLQFEYFDINNSTSSAFLNYQIAVVDFCNEASVYISNPV